MPFWLWMIAYGLGLLSGIGLGKQWYSNRPWPRAQETFESRQRRIEAAADVLWQGDLPRAEPARSQEVRRRAEKAAEILNTPYARAPGAPGEGEGT